MISASTRRAKETASLNVLRWYSKKRFKQRLGSGVMSRRIIRQQIGLVYILFSLRWNVEFILQSRTLSWCSQIFYELFGGGTRLAMPNNMRAGLIVIEAWFRGY